ncbi:MotA/TolQ/ExbB proton channel family protein [Myxococcota bacterium]|nr:MotA/TolQ/ExbB proton channel family protein [Myxococcota bacterium]
MSPVSELKAYKELLASLFRNRMFLIGLGAFAMIVMILFMMLLFPRGSALAKLLLDWQSDSASMVLPYPFTIQNIMWILFGVALGDAYFRNVCAQKEAKSLTLGLLPESQSVVITKDNLPEIMEKAYLLKAGQNLFLARLIHSTAMSFQTHTSAQQAHEIMNSQVELELHHLDLKYTLIRYISWLLPTLGFIGTVVGIASALNAIDVSRAPRPAEIAQVASAQNPDDATEKSQPNSSEEVTNKLGLAFNTTIVALLQSVLVVLLAQFLQKKEEEMVNVQSQYCLDNLVVRLYNPDV